MAMYSHVQDFLDDYKWESESTKKVLNALTPESLQHLKAKDDETSIGNLAAHLGEAPVQVLNQGGLDLTMPTKSENPTVSELAGNYEKVIGELFEKVKNWSDEELQQTANFFGMEWKKGLALTAMLHHEIHHRGQLTAMMRNAGVIVPSVYGPNREETAEWKAKMAADQAQ